MIKKNQDNLDNTITFKGSTFIELHKFSEKEDTFKNISNLYTNKDPVDIHYEAYGTKIVGKNARTPWNLKANYGYIFFRKWILGGRYNEEGYLSCL